MYLDMEVIKQAAIAIGMPVLRSVVGWAQHALKDNKVTPFEQKQLVATIIRVGLISSCIYFGADGLGIDINAVGSAATAVIIDMLPFFKKKGK